MKKITYILAALYFVAALLAHPAQAGDSGREGGADPLANDFMEYGWEIYDWLVNRSVPGVTADAASFGRELDRIQESLDGRYPLLRFPDVKILNCYGAPKVGCVREDRSIDVARRAFLDLELPARYEIVALEFFKLLEVAGRYPQARTMANYKREFDFAENFIALEDGVYVVKGVHEKINTPCAYFIRSFYSESFKRLEVRPTVDPQTGYLCEGGVEHYTYKLNGIFIGEKRGRTLWYGTFAGIYPFKIKPLQTGQPLAPATQFQLMAGINKSLEHRYEKVANSETALPFAYRARFVRKDEEWPFDEAWKLCLRASEDLESALKYFCLSHHSVAVCRNSEFKFKVLDASRVAQCEMEASLKLK
jgi:hypothetical protein